MNDTSRRQLELLEIIHGGTQESDKAVMELITLCMDFVHREAWRFGGKAAAEHEDLVSEGIYGLLEAVRSFDVSAGTSFLTYATPYIRHRMAEYMDGIGALRMTSYARRKLGDERASALRSPASLDELREAVSSLSDMQRDPVCAGFEESEGVSIIREAIAALPEREAAAVSAYYGIGGPRRPFSDLAEEYGVSGRMMYKYLSSGLGKLKKDERLKALAGC